MANWFNKIVAERANSGEIRALELQIKMLKDKKSFLPKQIELLQRERADLPRQINALESQLDALRRQNR